MPTRDELEKAFSVYFDEVGRCRKAGCYWALLHVVVALPDICSAMESENGWATEKKYIEWCERYCPGGVLSRDDYRDIRNVVLHQGRTRSRGRGTAVDLPTCGVPGQKHAPMAGASSCSSPSIPGCVRTHSNRDAADCSQGWRSRWLMPLWRRRG